MGGGGGMGIGGELELAWLRFELRVENWRYSV